MCRVFAGRHDLPTARSRWRTHSPRTTATTVSTWFVEGMIPSCRSRPAAPTMCSLCRGRGIAPSFAGAPSTLLTPIPMIGPDTSSSVSPSALSCQSSGHLSQGGSQRILPRRPSPIRPSRSSERQIGARRDTHQLPHSAPRAPVGPDSISQNPSSIRSSPSSTLSPASCLDLRLSAGRSFLLGGELPRWGRHVFIQGDLTSSGTNNGPGYLRS